MFFVVVVFLSFFCIKNWITEWPILQQWHKKIYNKVESSWEISLREVKNKEIDWNNGIKTGRLKIKAHKI